MIAAMTLREKLVAGLRRGAGHWITDEEAGYWIRAIEGEWDRVVLWRGRTNPRTGAAYSWYGAARVVAHNPPTFDRVWAEAFRPEAGAMILWAGDSLQIDVQP